MAPANDVQDSSKFCLKWDGFHSNITSMFETLRQDEELVDITICCEGRKIGAHKIILSAASPYFRDLLKENPCQHPVFFLRDTRCTDMAAIIEFVYRGNVNVSQAQLASFIQTAELLQIRGLSGDSDKQECCEKSSAEPVRSETTSSGAASARLAAQPDGPRYRPPPATPHSPRPAPAKRRRVTTPPPRPSPPERADSGGGEPVADAAQVKLEKVEVREDGQLDAVPYHPAPSDLEQVLLPARGAPPARGTFQCPVCLQKYSSLASLHNHISLHRGNTVCHICGQTCSTTSNRNRHMANKHAFFAGGWRSASDGGGGATRCPVGAGEATVDPAEGASGAGGVGGAHSHH